MKGLKVKIVIFVFYKNCNFKKSKFYIFLAFGPFHQKSGLIGQKQN